MYDYGDEMEGFHALGIILKMMLSALIAEEAVGLAQLIIEALNHDDFVEFVWWSA